MYFFILQPGEIVIDWSAAIISAASDDVEYYPASSDEDSYAVDDSVLNELSNRDETIAQERMGARESQKIAALKNCRPRNANAKMMADCAIAAVTNLIHAITNSGLY